MRMSFNLPLAGVVLVICGVLAAPASAQRAGENVSVQYGTVSSAREVNLQSDAIPGGAMVGGTLGLLSASGKSSGKKARNAMVGTVAGAATAGVARGDTRGMLYDVDIGSQGKVQVVSDQREIQKGDCVAVEKAGSTANIRRVTAAYCDSTNSEAVKAVAANSATEAQECLQAKQQLVDAATSEAADLASKKIGLLCND